MRHSTDRVRLFVALAMGAALLPAQGLRWADSQQRPTLHLRELANGDWMFTFTGWSTTSLVPFGGDDQAAAVGVDYGARTVRATESEFIRGGEGGEAVQAAWFPFAPDTSVDAVFVAHSSPFLVWSGFRAPVGTVPDHDGGSLSFRVPLLNGARLDAFTFMAGLGIPYVGAAHVDAQGQATGTVFVEQAGAVRLADICFYKFDRGVGGLAINYAGVEGGALGVGRLTRPTGSPWAPGRFGGSALSGGSTCDTGFHGDIGARFTAAWFMRQRTAPTGVSPVFALGALRCFTGGPAGTGLQCVGWGGTPLVLSDDIQAQAAAGWVHVALVVDSDNAEARWYVNGVRRNRTPISAIARVPATASPLLIGSSNAQTCAYDLDEFRFAAEAVDGARLRTWSIGSPEAAQPFTSACGASLSHSGVPSLGSANFVFRVEAAPGAVVALFATAVPGQPMDLGVISPGLSGCQWFAGTGAPLSIFQAANGLGAQPVPIPNDPALRGVELFVQALVVEPSLTLHATNAYAMSLN